MLYNAGRMETQSADEDPELPDLNKLITLKQAADEVDLSYSHLRLLAREHRIWVIRIGHQWLTTLEAVTAYLDQGNRPGPKPNEDRT